MTKPDLLRRRLLTGAALGLAGAVSPRDSALAQVSYPSRPITFICPWPPGGTADGTMRVLAAQLGRALSQEVKFRNVAGGAGMLGARAISTAAPDGYTIGQIPISVVRFAQLNVLTFDPLKDFSFLARTSGQSFGIVVRTDSPYRTLDQLLAAARARPDMLTYASAGIASAAHVGMAELLLAAEARMHHVPYKGGAPGLRDLLGGEVDVLADSSSWVGVVRQRKARLLATWGAERMKAFPNVPTLRELGYDVVVEAPNGVGGPAGLAPSVATRLRAGLRTAILSPEFRKACDRIHAPVLYQDADAYRDFVRSQNATQKRLIEKLRLHEELRSL